jgi:hypothetical protein
MPNYGLIVQTIDVKPGMEDATANEMSEGMAVNLNKALQGAVRGVNNLPGGGSGEILSHNITRIGRHLVVSFPVQKSD